MSTIIEIKKDVDMIDGKLFEVIHTGCSAGYGEGIIKMDAGIYKDDDTEIRITFQDTIFDRTGNYIPIDLNKEDLKQFIDFLSGAYKIMV